VPRRTGESAGVLESEPHVLEDFMEPNTRDNAPLPASSQPEDAERATTRRTFLRDVGKRAVYVAPVIVALTASQAQAAASPSCLPSGTYCELDSDCCSGNCSGGSMQCAMA
jgi:hypothetical protein